MSVTRDSFMCMIRGTDETKDREGVIRIGWENTDMIKSMTI